MKDLLRKTRYCLPACGFTIYCHNVRNRLQEDGTMQSWKARLLMVFTMLALILAVSVPGMADVELECDAEDGGTCEEMVSYESESLEDEGTELEDEIVEEPFAVEGAEECYPFCSLEWWPW